MPVFSVEGKLGTGKTKFCVWQAQRALREGRRVASNVDLHLEQLVPELRTASYQRIPDKPTSRDLQSIGHGNPETYDEDRNGLLILDELGSWLNTRSFQDKDRLPVIDWLIHARKLGWDVYLIVQDAGMIDKQVREALIEYQCKCLRLDKVKIPLIGSLLSLLFGRRAGYMPRMHMVTARVGNTPASQVIAERWSYRGDDLHAAYDTRQIFKHDPEAATFTVLHAQRWTVAAARVGWWARLWGRAPARPHGRDPCPRRLRLMGLLRQLPPDEAVRYWRRLDRLGAI